MAMKLDPKKLVEEADVLEKKANSKVFLAASELAKEEKYAKQVDCLISTLIFNDLRICNAFPCMISRR